MFQPASTGQFRAPRSGAVARAVDATRSSIRTLRRGTIRSLQRVGIDDAVGNSGWRRRRLLILAYHGVSLDDEHLWNGQLYISAKQLEERLQLLRSAGCAILPFNEAVDRLYSGALQVPSVALTFDDGYADFASRAHPLLKRYGAPATVYLRTNRLGRTPGLRLVCAYMFWKARRSVICLPEVQCDPFDISTETGRADASAAIAAYGKRLKLNHQEDVEFIRRIASDLGLDGDAFVRSRVLQLMSTDEVRRMAGDGVDFQLHTHTHQTPDDADQFARELRTNRQHIEALSGKPATHFCYPSGNYAAQFVRWLDSLNVESATTCDPGLASRISPRLLLPRFVDGSFVTAGEFRGWITGTSAWLSRQRSYSRAV